MKNRERLNKMALIDILDMFQRNTEVCAGYFLTGKHGIDQSCDRCGTYKTCYDCIAAWLNEEEIKND